MRSQTLKLLFFFISGILLFVNHSIFLLCAVFTALFFVGFIKKKISLLLFAVVFILLGATNSYLHDSSFVKRYNLLLSADTFEGYVIDKSKDAYLVKNYKSNYCVKVFSYAKISLLPGDYIVFKGKAQKLPEIRLKKLKIKKIHAYVYMENNPLAIDRSFHILMLPYKIRYELCSALINADKTGGAFICGLVSGSSDAMEEDNLYNFSELGLSHVLAISGFNLGIVYYFLNICLKKLAAKPRNLLILFACALYTVFGGLQPSITRAFFMIFIVTMAKLFVRSNDSLNSIVLSAFIMLLLNPFFIFDLGFQLSYLGTLGIILFQAEIKDRLYDRIPFHDEVAVSLSAFLATFPVVLSFKGYFSLLTLLINILIAPVISLLTIFSFVTALFYILLNLSLLLYPVTFLGLLFTKIIALVANYNVNIYIGSQPIIFTTIYYLLLFSYFNILKIKRNRNSKSIIHFTLLFILIIISTTHYKGLKIHALNVGQGDCFFIETPDRQTILIDAGPTKENYDAGRSKIVPYIHRLGYNRIDILLLSHFHADHTGGLDYILKHLQVDKVMAFDDPERTIACRTLSKGDSIKIGDLTLKIIYPDKNQGISADENELCLIIKLIYKNFSMLFTGDASAEMMAHFTGTYTMLKMPHHGSIKSYSEDFYSKSNLSASIISVGKNNYGHPSEKLLDILKKRNIKVYRTDINGDIIIMTSGKDYEVKVTD